MIIKNYLEQVLFYKHMITLLKQMDLKGGFGVKFKETLKTLN